MQNVSHPIVITGAEGQLGSELCRQLGSRAVGWRRQDCDLLDGQNLANRISRVGPSVLINTAAYTAVDRAEQEPTLCRAINGEAVAVLAEACEQSGTLLVQISTDYVFGADRLRTTPWLETDEPRPINLYGESKLLGEQHAARCRQHLIVRTCGLYGRRTKPTQSNFVDTMLRLSGERDRLRIVDDQHCTPSYVPHVASAILSLIDHHARGLYHVVNEGVTTWYNFADEIFCLAGKSVALDRISTAEYGAPAARPAFSVLDIRKYQAHGGFLMPHWKDALAEYLQSLGTVSPLAGNA